MKNQNNAQPVAGKDFFSVLDAQIASNKEIFEDVQSSVDTISEIVARIKNRNQIENELDKMDLESVESLNNHIKDMLNKLNQTTGKK